MRGPGKNGAMLHLCYKASEPLAPALNICYYANGQCPTKKTGGENIDDVIIRWIKFKKNNNKVYIYKEEEETKDEQ